MAYLEPSPPPDPASARCPHSPRRSRPRGIVGPSLGTRPPHRSCRRRNPPPCPPAGSGVQQGNGVRPGSIPTGGTSSSTSSWRSSPRTTTETKSSTKANDQEVVVRKEIAFKPCLRRAVLRDRFKNAQASPRRCQDSVFNRVNLSNARMWCSHGHSRSWMSMLSIRR